jgi:tripartite-type tricarboxylate transporter receptor subunit TctC
VALDRSPAWIDARDRFGWRDAYLGGDEFARFVTDESERVAGALRRFGLV